MLTLSNGEKKGLAWSQAALPVQAADQSHRLVQSTLSTQSHIFILNFLWYLQSVLKICDIFGADPDLWLLDPDPAPDPTPFFSDFKDTYFFLTAFLQAHYFQSSKFISLQNFFVKILVCKIISIRSTPLWEKGRIRIPNSTILVLRIRIRLLTSMQIQIWILSIMVMRYRKL
jgi:hypothetical protein